MLERNWYILMLHRRSNTIVRVYLVVSLDSWNLYIYIFICSVESLRYWENNINPFYVTIAAESATTVDTQRPIFFIQVA